MNATAPETASLPSRRRLRAEVLIVLGMTLGQSAIYAIVRFIERNVDTQPIRQQSTTINQSLSSIEYFDLTRQILRVGFGVVPVLLVLYLLSANGRSWKAQLGLGGRAGRWGRDLATGAGLAALIGLPGLGLYAVGRAIGQNVRINTNGLPDAWWAAVILLASAAVAGLVEEIIVVGFLMTRLRQLRWSIPLAIMASAVLRGAYHLYQGWPMALGNVVMGVVFALYYVRTGRVGPLIAAHWMLDAVSFVGPELAPQSWLDAINGA